MNTVIGNLAVIIIYVAPLFLALIVCGLISDWILPRCPYLLYILELVFGIDLGP